MPTRYFSFINIVYIELQRRKTTTTNPIYNYINQENNANKLTRWSYVKWL